jgi:hypothetical protein
MSRRITFIALAATATLIATQAAADRECFEDSCRLREAAESQAAAPQAQAVPEPTAQASNPIPEFAAPETAAETAAANEARADVKSEPKSEPVLAAPAPVVVAKPEPVAPPPQVVAKPEPSLVPAAATRLQPYAPPPPVVVKSEPEVVLPRVASEPAPRRAPAQIVQPQISPSQALPRYEAASVRRDEPRVPIPQYAERPQPTVAAPAPARPTRTVPPAAARVERAPVAVPAPAVATRVERAPAAVAVPARNYAVPQRPVAIDVPRQAPSIASAAVIEVPGEIQTGDGLVTVYPNLRPDPAWKLCQIDSRDLGRRSYRCTAYSYHPYGEGGYRPYGTYKNYPTSPGYVVAPNAKIISLNPND